LIENVERDRRQTRSLMDAGWRVVRIWEHEVYNCLEKTVESIVGLVTNRKAAPKDRWVCFQVVPSGDDQNRETRYAQQLLGTKTRASTGPRNTRSR